MPEELLSEDQAFACRVEPYLSPLFAHLQQQGGIFRSILLTAIHPHGVLQLQRQDEEAWHEVSPDGLALILYIMNPVIAKPTRKGALQAL